MSSSDKQFSTSAGLKEKLAGQPVSIQDLIDLSDRCSEVLDSIREAMLEPHPRKTSPVFSSRHIQAYCGYDKQRFHELKRLKNLPKGHLSQNGRTTEYTLEDLITWYQSSAGYSSRPGGKRGRVIATANFKGGTGKSTTSVAMAQALTLKGRKVLLIDLDPQGSATQLFGFSPDAEIKMEQTAAPLLSGDESTLEYAVMSTYWHNLDLIPACGLLYDGEFALMGRNAIGHSSNQSFAFWEVLQKGIEPLLVHYDAVMIDTPPALGFLTMNALYAADGILMTCPPDALDFASSSQFWSLFTDVFQTLPGVKENKQYDFAKIVPVKVKSDPIHTIVRDWMSKAYGDYVSSVTIPDSNVAKSTAAQVATVYDLSKPEGSTDAYRRYKHPLDELANYLDQQLNFAWERAHG